jgi:hypothetical protein
MAIEKSQNALDFSTFWLIYSQQKKRKKRKKEKGYSGPLFYTRCELAHLVFLF